MDDHIGTILLLLLTGFLILLNGFFVAAEFAIIKIRSTRLRELADGGSVSAKHAYNALRQLDAYLSATQLGVTLASLGLGWVGEPTIARRVVEPLFHAFHVNAPHVTTTVSLVLAFGIITFLHITFGELAPKWLAIQRAEKIALAVAGPMSVIFWLFKPFTAVLRATASAIVRWFGIQPANAHDTAHSEEELRMIITASGAEHGGTLRESQAELLDNVFDFGHRLARQVMIHRTEIAVLDIDDPLERNVQLAQESGHTRYPIIHEDIDTVIGFVHTKDLFALYQRDPQGDLHTVMRDILLAPETVRVDMLLRQLQRNRQHLAVLVDEYGGTAGLATIADLLEELVGDLPDEFEPPEDEWLIRVDNQNWSVDGRLPISDLEEALGRELSCEESCDTVGGYAFWAFGKIPEANDVVERDGITLQVTAMDGRRVSRVTVNAESDSPESRVPSPELLAK